LPQDYEPPRYQYKLELIHFAKNVLTIDTSFIPKLNEQLKPFITDTSSIYTIHSYTDDSGTPLINEDFSNKRALNVMKHLMELGISPAKIQVRAWADADPLMPNDSDYNRYLNRRILIQIRSLQNLNACIIQEKNITASAPTTFSHKKATHSNL
jgi:outer membrane protein OmpA-like peptidoglycan-associated protein